MFARPRGEMFARPRGETAASTTFTQPRREMVGQGSKTTGLTSEDYESQSEDVPRQENANVKTKTRKPRRTKSGYPALPLHKHDIFIFARDRYNYPVEDEKSVTSGNIKDYIYNKRSKEQPKIPFK